MLDASITLAWCFEDQATALSVSVRDRLADEPALVPELWPFEVANALVTAERRGRLTRSQASRFVQLLNQLPITVEELGRAGVLGAVMALAQTSGLTSYDASYLVLAASGGLPLATTDTALREAALSSGVALIQPQ
ncbi:MAG: type II toxin-antitoxin system VapC family toxin [Candidatus Dormiibacterota bacterium]